MVYRLKGLNTAHFDRRGIASIEDDLRAQLSRHERIVTRAIARGDLAADADPAESIKP